MEPMPLDYEVILIFSIVEANLSIMGLPDKEICSMNQKMASSRDLIKAFQIKIQMKKSEI